MASDVAADGRPGNGIAHGLHSFSRLEGMVRTDGLRQLLLSYFDLIDLHRIRGSNALLQSVADLELASARRCLAVTTEDVANGRHVDVLRRHLRDASPGQTIRLSGSGDAPYVLGDETIEGHAAVRIDPNQAVHGRYVGRSNRWCEGYGPLIVETPGLRLAGPLTASDDGRDGMLARSGSVVEGQEDPAELAFRADERWSAAPVAIVVQAPGVSLENLVVTGGDGGCHAVEIGKPVVDDEDEDEDDDEEERGSSVPGDGGDSGTGQQEGSGGTIDDDNGPPTMVMTTTLRDRCSATLRNCAIQGTIHLRQNSSAILKGCAIFDAPMSDRAAVSVRTGASIRVERTRIFECGVPDGLRHDFPVGRFGAGGLWLERGSSAAVRDVSVVDNVPCGVWLEGCRRSLLAPAKLCIEGDFVIEGNRRANCDDREPHGNICLPSGCVVGRSGIVSDGSLAADQTIARLSASS